ncbi:unnamed protein product [Mytilus coruscus]|uniref:B box-type domain-containing protein n=1 Tax=Mytilus coruscus TaxID=42192 RepID=A0A6J8DBH3_MYTCO|nr:unnamed protein product [Mytilus coruscus]
MSTFNINTAKKEDVSLRLKQHNVKRAKDETKKLETESRKMEEKLKELRMAMNREKEERENQGGGFWSRGQTGKLNSYATDVLNKPTKSSKDPSKRKVKVLKDSPLDIPERSSQPGTFGHLAKQSIGNTPREKIKGPKCGQCEEKRAMVSCVQCSEHYCAQCFAAFHLKGALKKHRSVPLSASGPRQCMSPRPTPPPSNREYQNGYQSAEGAVNLHTMNIHQHDRNSPEGASGSFDGPSLLDGTYDESENAVAFQQALQAWRTGEAASETNNKPKTITPRRHSPRKAPRDNVEQMDHSTGTNDKSPEIDIKFTNSLSYAERLLLKKHRRTDLDGLSTPRLDSNATTPRTYKTDSTTPRIQSFPEREDSFDSDNSTTPRIQSFLKREDSFDSDNSTTPRIQSFPEREDSFDSDNSKHPDTKDPIIPPREREDSFDSDNSTTPRIQSFPEREDSFDSDNSTTPRIQSFPEREDSFDSDNSTTPRIQSFPEREDSFDSDNSTTPRIQSFPEREDSFDSDNSTTPRIQSFPEREDSFDSDNSTTPRIQSFPEREDSFDSDNSTTPRIQSFPEREDSFDSDNSTTPRIQSFPEREDSFDSDNSTTPRIQSFPEREDSFDSDNSTTPRIQSFPERERIALTVIIVLHQGSSHSLRERIAFDSDNSTTPRIQSFPEREDSFDSDNSTTPRIQSFPEREDSFDSDNSTTPRIQSFPEREDSFDSDNSTTPRIQSFPEREDSFDSDNSTTPRIQSFPEREDSFDSDNSTTPRIQSFPEREDSFDSDNSTTPRIQSFPEREDSFDSDNSTTPRIQSFPEREDSFDSDNSTTPRIQSFPEREDSFDSDNSTTPRIQSFPEREDSFDSDNSTTPRIQSFPEREDSFDSDNSTTPRIQSFPERIAFDSDNSTTPRIQSFPEREDSFDSDTSFERVEFRALYEAAMSNQPLSLARHDEDNISIIEIQNDERSDNIEETTACNVQEADDLDMWAIKSQRTTDLPFKSQNVDDSKPPHFPKSARRKSGKNLKSNEHIDQNVEMEVPTRPNSSKNNLKNLETVKSSASEPCTDRVPSTSWKGTNSSETGNRVSSAKQRPPSSRPASRAKTSQSRPGSRAKSRASSRLNGESHLTMEPSNALKQIASLPLDENVSSYTSGLGDFLMAGVQPAEQERTMTPSKHKKSGQEKFKLSYTFYSMSPRSWKPDKSLSDAVPSETIQPIETPRLADPEDPLAILDAKNSTEVHGLGSAKGRNMLSQYSAQYDEESETKKVVDGNISPASTTRSLSRVDTWLRDTTLPEMPLESSQSTQQNKSEDIIPRPSSKQNNSSRPGSKTPRTPRPESKSSKTPRLQSQITSGPTSQTSKTPRQTSKTPRPLSRLRSSQAEDGRLSRAIVVDGDNLSKFDEVGAKEKSNIEDVETLDKLEWELASQSGRLTADGQISRLSVLEDDQNSTGSLDSHRSFSRMSQQDQGYDINIRLREDELSDDINTDNEHDLDEMDVKALH